MAMLTSCMIARCSANISVHRRYNTVASIFTYHNVKRNDPKYGPLAYSRPNSTLAHWRDSYNNLFKTITESDAVSAVKDGLILAHDLSGLPWGWTVILTTFGLRAVITFPLGVYQSLILAKLELIKQEFVPIIHELKKETAIAVKRFNLTEKVARPLYNASLKKQWRILIERDNCHPLKATLVVFLQLPMWILLSLSYRCMSYQLGQDPIQSYLIAKQLSLEGIAWMSNLLVPDPTCILPLSVSLFNLCIIELQAATKENPTKAQRVMTNIFRAFAVISFPIALTVPSCMSLYWGVSSGLALSQNVVLMSPGVRRFFKIPHTPSQKDTPYQFAWNNFKSKWTFSSK